MVKYFMQLRYCTTFSYFKALRKIDGLDEITISIVIYCINFALIIDFIFMLFIML